VEDTGIELSSQLRREKGKGKEKSQRDETEKEGKEPNEGASHKQKQRWFVRYQVVSSGDRMNITRQMQIEFFHGNDLRVTAACSTALRQREEKKEIKRQRGSA
jgi:hypothetical protein